MGSLLEVPRSLHIFAKIFYTLYYQGSSQHELVEVRVCM